MFVGQVFQPDLHIIFVLQTVFQDIKLKNTDYTHDNLFHPCVKFLENLDGAFLGYLVDPFYKLLPFHRIHLAYSGKMFGCERGDALISELFFGGCQRIAYGKYARIKYAYDISAIGFLDHLPLAGHHLLRLGQAHILPPLDMADRHACLEFTGADPHKGDPVPVCLIHICLYLEYKS